MRWLFQSHRMCGSERRKGLPRGRFYVCGLREGHRGDHCGKLFGLDSEPQDGTLRVLARVMVWQRRM